MFHIDIRLLFLFHGVFDVLQATLRISGKSLTKQTESPGDGIEDKKEENGLSHSLHYRFEAVDVVHDGRSLLHLPTARAGGWQIFLEAC